MTGLLDLLLWCMRCDRLIFDRWMTVYYLNAFQRTKSYYLKKNLTEI